jgi:anti-sigma-K factor RskA
MSHSEQASPRDLAAAYALGALSPEETREFETFLADSPDTQHEVAEFRDVAALLGLAEPEGGAGSSLRERVLARVAEQKTSPIGPRFRGVWTALAASLIAVVGLGIGMVWLRRELAGRDTTIAALNQLLEARGRDLRDRQAILDAILDPSVRLYQLTSSGDPEPGIQLFWNQRRNEALLNGSRLKPVPSGRAYQLWFIKDGKPVPSITFVPSPDGSATRTGVPVPREGKVSAAAITVEPEGGSAQPTSPIVLVGPLEKS